MRDDIRYLEDILERIQLTEEFVEPGRAAVFGSRLIQEAVIRNLEVIGEASRHISETLREQNPDVSWRQIAAFRNFAIHTYWEIKLERIWDIIEKELPILKSQIETILNAISSSDTKDTNAS
ncbi:MAG: DUF86 domain-containing protein [Chloroflexi bacterium]|nr:DUF86 domain-containing protein [Chloroflexota bacterium]